MANDYKNLYSNLYAESDGAQSPPSVAGSGLKLWPTIEIAFLSQPMSTSPIWTDVTPYTFVHDTPLQIVRGRTDEFSRIQPGTLTLGLDNSDGRFTRGNTSSPYWPNVRQGRRIRVSYLFGAVTNLLQKVETDFEGGIGNWVIGDGGTVVSSTEQPSQGVGSLKATANGSGVLWLLNEASVANGDSIVHVSPGQSWTFGIKLKSASATRGWRAVLRWLNEDTTYHSQTDGSYISCSSGSYTQISVTGTVPSGVSKLLVQFETQTTPANGEVWYADEAQLTQTSSLQTWVLGPTRYRRFDGHVNEFPAAWTHALYAPITITATDRFKRFGQLGELRSILEEEALVDAVEVGGLSAAYYPLGEPSGSMTATSVTEHPQANLNVINYGAGKQTQGHEPEFRNM